MPTNDGASAVSNCYVFKSQLQEYAQKGGLTTPVYETTKDGPSHEPSFRSTVIVNDVKYDSLPGFPNRKTAEQSAAEVALLELAKSSHVKECVSLPVHETGLCKNLLQEYAQKMNYAIPLYKCQRSETTSREAFFQCTVDIGGIQYIGAAARSKKEAEIKAARTALLAIKTSPAELANKQVENSSLTVVPCKKRGQESGNISGEAASAPKSKKARLRKRNAKKRSEKNWDRTVVGNNGNLVAKSELAHTDAPGFHSTESMLQQSEALMIPQEKILESGHSKEGISTTEVALATIDDSNLIVQSLVSNVSDSNHLNACVKATSGEITSMEEKGSVVSGACQMPSVMNDSALVPMEAASIRPQVTGDEKNSGQETSLEEEVNIFPSDHETPSVVEGSTMVQMDSAGIMAQVSYDVETCGEITSVEEEINLFTSAGDTLSAVIDSAMVQMDAASIMASVEREGEGIDADAE